MDTILKQPVKSKRELQEAGGVFHGSSGHEVVHMPDGSQYIRMARQDFHPDMFCLWKPASDKSADGL